MTFEVTCGCGWTIKTDGKAALMAAVREHQTTCPLNGNHTVLGDALVALIRKSGVAQSELAERTGFSQKHISQMMHQRSGSLLAWDQLLRAAGVTPTLDARIV